MWLCRTNFFWQIKWSRISDVIKRLNLASSLKSNTKAIQFSIVFYCLLARLPMSLCNRELSVVCCRCLWTVLLATGLITETSYLAHTSTYAPNIYT